MAYLVKLNTFEGPLDLLLHLIAKAKVRIEDISITNITRQYLDYLESMQQFDIEIASEFLVMAATLIHIKSCVLLPKGKPELEEEAEDPRQELITRLLEYKRYKEAGDTLGKREALVAGIYSKLPEEFVHLPAYQELDLDVDAQALYAAFMRLTAKKGIPVKLPAVHQIARDPVTLTQRIRALSTLLKLEGETSFFRLFSPLDDRGDIILTFLALLEMLKENVIAISQNDLFDDIIIKRRSHHG